MLLSFHLAGQPTILCIVFIIITHIIYLDTLFIYIITHLIFHAEILK